MIAKTWKEISEKAFEDAKKKAEKLLEDSADNLTWFESEDEFCYKGTAYRRFLGVCEKGKVVM